MKRYLLAIIFQTGCFVALSQGLYLDSLLTKSLDSSRFSKEEWYWTQVVPAEDEAFIEVPGWSKVVAYQDASYDVTGSMVSMREKSYRSFRNIIPVKADTILLKLNANQPLFNLSASSIQSFNAQDWRFQERQRLITQGLFFGIIIVMALYNLMIFMAVKDQSYLWYVLSIVGFGLYMAFYYGFSIEHLWPSLPHWNAYFFAFIIPITNICRILFTKTYLHMPEYVPKWNKFFNFMLGVYSIPLTMWFISWMEWRDWLNETNYVIGLFGSITMIAITFNSVLVYLKGYKPALWFLIAFALFNVGGILFIFRELHYLPDNFFTRYIIQIGAVAQVVLFSLGLSDRLNRTRKMLAMEKIEKEKLAKEKEAEQKEQAEKRKVELEASVKERTKALEETLDQLKVSEGELRELNRVKSKLFSIISHELKSPLTTVDSYLNLLIKHFDKLSPEEISELSEKTRFSLQNLTLLMDNLLLWSRLQQDSLSFNPVSIDLRKALDKSIKLFSLLIEQKRISLEVHTSSEEHLNLFADKDMIEFVIRNLIHNAIKFTPKNGLIRVEVSGDDEFAKVSIMDSGIGMSQTLIDQILNKGESITRVGTEEEKGSGIGLLMCKDFIEKNGGCIEIVSGKGTTVNFHAPLDKDHQTTRMILTSNPVP